MSKVIKMDARYEMEAHNMRIGTTRKNESSRLLSYGLSDMNFNQLP